MTRYPFADRLALARRLVARGAARPPVHLADQLDAAGRDARRLHDHIGAALPILEPGRAWYHRIDAIPSDEVRAYLLAAVLDCVNVCVHLRRGGPRPAIARLPLRRVDCERCVQTLRRPTTAADECDVCQTRDVVLFSPFACRLGPAIVAGDACPDCADVLGIRQEATA